MRALVIALFVGGVQLHAQAPAVIAFEGAGLYATVQGSDFRGVHAGTGFDAQARFEFGGGGVGFGMLRTTHAVDNATEKMVLSGAYFEPRYIFIASPLVRPFVNARLAILFESLNTQTTLGSASRSATGSAFGIGGGIAFVITPSIDLSLAFNHTSLSFGDVTVNGTTQRSTSTSGSSSVVRLALAFVAGR